MSEPIRVMKQNLLRGFCCEIQRTKQCTQFHTLHWSSDIFTFEKVGIELRPGDHTITVYSNGIPIVSTEIKIKKIQTLLGIWIGGLNPKKPEGQSGIMIYQGDIKSLLSKAEDELFTKNNNTEARLHEDNHDTM